MRKQYLFMSAFTVFVFGCAVVRAFYGAYTMWPVIVAAVTVTSSIFTFSDLTESQAHALSCFTKEIMDKIDSRLANNLDEDLKKEYQHIRKVMEKDGRIAAGLGIASNVSVFIGFLALFVLMTFENVVAYFIDKQEVMTVLAFGWILLSQLLDALKEKYQEYWTTQINELNEI